MIGKHLGRNKVQTIARYAHLGGIRKIPPRSRLRAASLTTWTRPWSFTHPIISVSTFISTDGNFHQNQPINRKLLRYRQIQTEPCCVRLAR